MCSQGLKHSLSERNVHMQTMDSDFVKTEIDSLIQALHNTRGPHAKLKMIHNGRGGHVTISSASERLLPLIKFSTPVLQIISTAVQHHNAAFSDGGLFLLLFTLRLLKQSLDSQVNRRLLIEIFDRLSSLAEDYLETANISIKRHVNIDDLEEMKAIAMSVLSSKPASCLRSLDAEHVSMLILKAFVQLLPSDEPAVRPAQDLQYIKLDGRPVTESDLVPGLLYQMPSLATHCIKDFSYLKDDCGSIKVILVNTSLAGDNTDAADVDYEVDVSLDVDAFILQEMKRCLESFIKDGVRLLLCQKVVHPSIKALFQRSNALVLDRLGIDLFKSAVSLVAKPVLSSLNLGYDRSKYIGTINSVKHAVIGKKSYVHLEAQESMLSTMIVCNRSEQALDELHLSCKQSLQVLCKLALTPYLLAGGGCWQINLAYQVKRTVLGCRDDLCDKIGCSGVQLDTAVEIFTTCLVSIVKDLYPGKQLFLDEDHAHAWVCHSDLDVPDSSSCQCRLLSRSEVTKLHSIIVSQLPNLKLKENESSFPSMHRNDQLGDLFISHFAAFKSAVSIANNVLGIQHIFVAQD